MGRAIEIILGLKKGFLSQEGEFSLSFNPSWPWQQYVGAGLWNLVLLTAGLTLIVYVYRREGRSRNVKIALGAMRAMLLGLVVAMLNRPVLVLSQNRTEPSVLAILIDDSISMRVTDAALDANNKPRARLEAAIAVLTDDDRSLIKELSKIHSLKFYKFDSTAAPIDPSLKDLQPVGQNTRIAQSIRAALDDLQGQRLAGVVILSDGRDSPPQPLTTTLAQLGDSTVKVYPVIVGSDRMPVNLAIHSATFEDTAFVGDIVNIRVTVQASGLVQGQMVTLRLKDKKTDQTMVDPSGKPVEQAVPISDQGTAQAELPFKALKVGQLDLVIEAGGVNGEIDQADNTREIQIAVLDAKVNVLYVEGYPRWEYRYLKNQMIRDPSIDISCLLSSADSDFGQEGDRPIARFPLSIEEFLDFDVLLLGDVDPREFSDQQLQLVSDFVARRGGGLGMIAGPRWSPTAWRGTAIEPILPVNISQARNDQDQVLTQGFRPVLTPVGADSPIFRFFADRSLNEKYLQNDLQAIFWYCKGVVAKPGVGEVYAEHPRDFGPDGRKAPILVVGRYGAGRTMFSAIDDSWRWRFYTGETVFDTYWVQQLRYLARSRKIGQRKIAMESLKPVYELGEQVRLTLRVLDPQLQVQLPEHIRVEIADASGQTVHSHILVRQQNQPDLYVLSYPADQVGKFVIRFAALAGVSEAVQIPIEVSTPRLELANPQVDRAALSRIAAQTQGQVLELGQARQLLPTLIPSAARVVPVESSHPLWNAPLVMVLFVFLLTAEWVWRKVYGML